MTFEQVNGRVVKAAVTPAAPVLARRGSMLRYTGRVAFRPVAGQGQGVGGMVGAAFAGESNPMMVTEGQGEVHYGFRGLHVTVLELSGETLTVEADRLLAHDAGLRTGVELIAQGGVRAAVRGAVAGQGRLTTKVSGDGSVALLSRGGSMRLPVSGVTVSVGPQAYLGYVGGPQVGVTAKVGFRDVVGRGSGEAFRLKASGHGTVYVQASEQKY